MAIGSKLGEPGLRPEELDLRLGGLGWRLGEPGLKLVLFG